MSCYCICHALSPTVAAPAVTVTGGDGFKSKAKSHRPPDRLGECPRAAPTPSPSC